MHFVCVEGETILCDLFRDKRTGMGISSHGIQQKLSGRLVRKDLQFYSESLQHRCFCPGNVEEDNMVYRYIITNQHEKSKRMFDKGGVWRLSSHD